MEIVRQHNKSYFLNDLKEKIRLLKKFNRSLPIDKILKKFKNVENYFHNKSYLNPSKFWGYGIGLIENGSEILHYNSEPNAGIYLTIFRINRHKLFFQYYRIDEEGIVHEKVLNDLRLELGSITELKIEKSPRIGRVYLNLYSSRFTKFISIIPSNTQFANYYKDFIEQLIGGKNLSPNELKSIIDSAYIHRKIDAITNATESDLVIGLSKDLMETICKTILERNSVTCEKEWKIAKLIKECNKLIEFDLDGMANHNKIDKSLKQILAGIGTSIQGITEIRNEAGTGHGKVASFIQINERYSKLIASLVFQLSYFYMDHFKEELS